MSASSKLATLTRQIKIHLRAIEEKDIAKAEKKAVAEIKKALRVLALDIRDYEYAETRAVQTKWAKIARNNLTALEQNVLLLGDQLGPTDIAELSAHIDLLKSTIE
ncbi:MAG: hypothetical protein QG629_875 [Patescibacteria group bacterium]|nr:hypothetical protein [Candidatus Saccharibacteria bacterium]MDQ5963792.1 hypothetical protein [Patescibacteria group bacterium]